MIRASEEGGKRVWKAADIYCPICGAEPGTSCDEGGGGFHVGRSRAAVMLRDLHTPRRVVDSPGAAAEAIGFMLDYLAFQPEDDGPPLPPRAAENVIAILEGYDNLRDRLKAEGYSPPYAFYDEPWMRRYEGEG